ncbi:hypothetical protein D9756_011193 [Leucocoprinus leucothites]|uniref:Endonuclease/exonuclease/phosphatase domain-containing protein n=1 Tax=Leucocoprinus leucothites TaxID=201217 RepID=A0A8H5FRC4_9AGAR|nr:hypothetical protein D9756_011193 [Leucoagaricus leucothites]
MSGKNKPISSVCIYSQNVGRSYALVDTILESKKLDFDIIFLQEPPWNHIQKAPSTTNPEGDDVIGAPIHPEWLCMVCPTKPNEPRPRTLTYVHRRLLRMRPILQQEWVNHRNIQILGLFNQGNYIHLLNIYSDSSSSAINFLSMNFIDIPNIIYMGGDFNCRSPEWDPSATYIPMSAITLTELVDGFNLTRSSPTSLSPTHFSSIESHDNSVINLIFCANNSTPHIIDVNSRLPLDHAPLIMDLPIRPDYINYKKRVLLKDSNEETAFTSQVSEHLAALDCLDIHSTSCLNDISDSISHIFNESWNTNSKIVWITNWSKEWWNPHCSETLLTYRRTKDRKDWRAFRAATQAAKCSFFDACIHEIALTNKRPWDLMEWVKQRKLPAIEGIHYQGQPCNDLLDLWNALHSSYNSASSRPVNSNILNEIKSLPPRSWANFSVLELTESLSSCANSSAPGPDHVSWRHLKSIVAHNECLKNIILIANTCVMCCPCGHSLSSMQRRAALWITGGAESIAVLSRAASHSSLRTPPPPSLHTKRTHARDIRQGLDTTPKAISRTASMSAYDGFKSPIPFRPFGEGFVGELQPPDPLNLDSRGDAWGNQEDGVFNNGVPTNRFFGPPPTSRLPHAIHGSAESANAVSTGTPATFFTGSSDNNDITLDVTHDVTGDIIAQPQEPRPAQPHLPDLKDPSNTTTEETVIVGEAAYKVLEVLKYVTNFFKHHAALGLRPGMKDPRVPQMGEPIYCLLTTMFEAGWDRLPINGENGLTIVEALRHYYGPPSDIPMTDSSPPPKGKGKEKKACKPSPSTIPTPLFPPSIVVGKTNPTARINDNRMNIDQAPPGEGSPPLPQNDVTSSGKAHDISSMSGSLKAKNDITSSKPTGPICISRAPPPPSNHMTPRNGNGNFECSVGHPSSDGQAQPSKPNPKGAYDMPPPIPPPDHKAFTKPLMEHFNKKNVSFTDTARRGGQQAASSSNSSSNIDGVKMREMILAFPELLYDKVLAMYKAGFGGTQSQAPEPSTTSIPHAKPKMTTHRPTRRQVLIPFKGNIIADRIKDFNKAAEFCNHGLTAAQSKLHVESVRESYNGILIATSGVASPTDLETIKSWLKKAWQLGDSIPIEPRLPQSKSFLKIVSVPYWVANSSNPLSPAFVEQALRQSSLFENIIVAACPRVMKASPKLDTAVVWFDIWDSQNGTKAKTLVNRTINFGQHIGTIHATSMHPGIAQCRNCWHWGHPTHACHALGTHCQICGGPHCIENHRSMAWCCKANPKSNPPHDATPDGTPCPHLENFKCLNCKGDHHANDTKCPFWRNRFNRTWHSNKAAKSRTACAVRANSNHSSGRVAV